MSDKLPMVSAGTAMTVAGPPDLDLRTDQTRSRNDISKRTRPKSQHTSTRRISNRTPGLALHHGPSRAPGIRLGDREPITDGGRVMWGLEQAVGYNSSPEMRRGETGGT
jgi:hypothetical protein